MINQSRLKSDIITLWSEDFARHVWCELHYFYDAEDGNSL